MNKTCIKCNSTEGFAKWTGIYCRTCYNERRKNGERKTTPGTEATFVSLDGQKVCLKCGEWKYTEVFRKWHNSCKECDNKQNKITKDAKRDEINAKRRDGRWAKDKERMDKDPGYKLIVNYRIRVWQIVKRPRTKTCVELLGCERETLVKWMEFNFKEGMSWKNYGRHWHIDHIIPCASFNISDDKDVEKCFHWTNLAPLEGIANIKKSQTVIPDMINYYKERVLEFKKLYNIIN